MRLAQLLALWARALIHLGRGAEAAPLVDELDAIGYRDRDLELLLVQQPPLQRESPRDERRPM